MSIPRINAIATGVVVALLVALLTSTVTNRLAPSHLDGELIAGTHFTISSAITEQPACSGAPALLVPGVARCLTYTVDNPLPDPITVDSIGIALDPAFAVPVDCPASNLDLTQASFAGALVVPANGSATVNRQIALADTGANQDGCQNQTFHFSYTGSATYIHVYSTATALVSSANPSTPGQQVTYTATVTTPGGPPPSPPTGTVTFKDGSSTIACETGSVPFDGTTATCQVTYPSVAGSPHPITAAYEPGPDGNFTGSTSPVLNQTVALVHTCPSISVTVSGGLTVNAGLSVCITITGQINGLVTVTANASLTLTGGRINGNVLVLPGGRFTMDGGTVDGTITSTGAASVRICGATKIGKGISVTGSLARVLIGDSLRPGCAGNTITGGVGLTGNLAGLQLGANNITGDVNVTTNVGPASAKIEIDGNSIVGTLSCTLNSPSPINGGHGNTVTKKRLGQCSAGGF